MEQNKIIEGNKLIAEFMGRKGKIQPHLYWTNLPKVMWVTVEQMEFHSSWDWLMPVVEKIYVKEEVEDMVIRLGSVEIFLRLRDWTIKSPCSPTNSAIIECWLAVVEFIKWYNNERK